MKPAYFSSLFHVTPLPLVRNDHEVKFSLPDVVCESSPRYDAVNSWKPMSNTEVLQTNVGLNIVWTKSSNFVQTLFKVCSKYVQIQTLFILCSNSVVKVHTLFIECSNSVVKVHTLFNLCSHLFIDCSNLISWNVPHFQLVQSMFKLCSKFNLYSNYVQRSYLFKLYSKWNLWRRL